MIIHEIDSHPGEDNVACYIDAKFRSVAAIEKNEEFFSNPEHVKKISEVKAIVEKFFAVKNGVYVNHRNNRGKPFSVIKVSSPRFPNEKTVSEKNNEFYYPLENMGIEVVFAKGTNSWLFRIKE